MESKPEYEPDYFKDDLTDMFFRIAIKGFIIVGIIAILAIMFS